MNAQSIDIKDMLEAESGLGLIFATNLFIGLEPTSPSNCVTIFDTQGYKSILTLDQKSFERPSVQIRVRNTSYETGWSLIDQISNVLHGRAQETWNNTLYSIIKVSSGPALLDWDENKRVRFIINLDMQRRSV